MTVIASEIERFDRLASTWWDASGPMRPLHVVNALRLAYISALLGERFLPHPSGRLDGLQVLDIGCGGGLLCEPLTRQGARVTGIDAARRNIAVAQRHAAAQGLRIDYRRGTVEEAVAPHERFAVVLALEVVEHVEDVAAFVRTAARFVAPGGLLLASTINRTLTSFFFAIVGAEYVLGLLPRGTHTWRRFVRPDELDAIARSSRLTCIDLRGMRYLPGVHRASWTATTAVNYLAAFAKLEENA